MDELQIASDLLAELLIANRAKEIRIAILEAENAALREQAFGNNGRVKIINEPSEEAEDGAVQ